MFNDKKLGDLDYDVSKCKARLENLEVLVERIDFILNQHVVVIQSPATTVVKHKKND